MPESFFNRRVARVFSREERDALLKGLDGSSFRLLDTADYRVMYFHEALVEYDYVSDAAALGKRLADVFGIVGKYFPANRIALKYHPGNGESKTPVTFGTRLPDFIPAEFLYDEKIKVYVGITSQALANVEKGVAVSLIDLIKFKQETIKEKLKKALIDWSRSDILFPKSLEEFEKILVGLKE